MSIPLHVLCQLSKFAESNYLHTNGNLFCYRHKMFMPLFVTGYLPTYLQTWLAPSASNTAGLSQLLTPKNSLAAPTSTDSSSVVPVSSQSLSILSMQPSKFYTLKHSHVKFTAWCL